MTAANPDQTVDDAVPAGVPLLDSALRQENYRRVFAAALLASQPPVIADLAGLELRTTMRILQWLSNSGLVVRHGTDWTANLDRISVTIDPVTDTDPLMQSPIPRRPQQRALFLERAAQLFEYDVRYPEAVVNEKLTALNPDFAALRRYLVEAGLLVREHGIYERIEP